MSGVRYPGTTPSMSARGFFDFCMKPAFEPSLRLVPVIGSNAGFPVRRVYCIGRNYVEHALEMNADPTREPPFYFMKPSDAVTPCVSRQEGLVTELPYPKCTKDVHHEAELVVCLGPDANSKICKELSDTELFAKCIFGYALGIDLTKRDVQAKAKSMRRPWEESKAFDQSAIIGPIYPMAGPLPWDEALLRLKTNGGVRQQSTLDKMIWPVVDVIKYIAERNEIAPGDLIYTGTPAGVGPLEIGDLCEVELVDKDEVTKPIVPGIECSVKLSSSLQ